MTEDAFFADLFRRLPAAGEELVVPPGDDCAAVDLGGGRLLLLAVDQVVGDRHYLASGPQAATPRQVGRKLLARNLSDIAAMGGRPRYCLVALGLPPEGAEAWAAELLAGVVEMGREYGVDMIGGDLAAMPTDQIGSLTILGTVDHRRLCRRRGARPGDLLLATGSFGDAVVSGHHLDFAPRVAEGGWLAEQAGASAMIDVSDGLLLDARRLAVASGVDLVLDLAALPRRRPQTSLAAALTDGEDYELLATVPAERWRQVAGQWPFAGTRLTPIGEVVAGTGKISDAAGNDLLARLPGGYDHLNGSGRR